MMNKYLDFLYTIVGREQEYEDLLTHLHKIEFYSLVPNDDNRGADGEHLREIFTTEVGPTGSSSLPDMSCTVLEMLIGVAKRLEFDLMGSSFERSVGEWFWVLIDNLGLEYCDRTAYYQMNAGIEVEERIRIFLERRYSFDGDGGLFPLQSADKDQREVEIWYQMSAWVIENYPI